jgi:hypothetical protein
VGVLSIGCSIEAAARMVACSPSTIRREMRLDPEFKNLVAEARGESEFLYIKRIETAARKEQYWRAAAWVLERCHPEHYGARSPNAITMAQLIALIRKIAEIIEEEIPADRYRQRVLKRLDALSVDFRQKPGNPSPAVSIDDDE